MDISEQSKQRFWVKVDKDGKNGCWNWVAGKDRDGYGCFTLNKVSRKAHRVSWVLYNGQIPEKMCICHTCDNPSCVNPGHLFLGTNQDNVDDKVKKGRQVKGERCYLFGTGYLRTGEKHGRAKLTEKEVLQIREIYSKGNITIRKLVKIFEMGKSSVGLIVNRSIWKHI